MAALVTGLIFLVPSVQAGEPAKSLLTPDNHTVILIDHQPQMAFATRSHSIEDVRSRGETELADDAARLGQYTSLCRT